MIIYNTKKGLHVLKDKLLYRIETTQFNDLFVERNAVQNLNDDIVKGKYLKLAGELETILLPPISSQEVWAAGVTYYRSRTARIEESKNAGGSDFYEKVYNSKRPELFFKTTPHRVVGHQQRLKLRSDSKWNVPEPELALAIDTYGEIIGYTVGNDLSSRDIESENPLYLPQAKIFDKCCALGPGIRFLEKAISMDTAIELRIKRGNELIIDDRTRLSEMKQKIPNLVEHLFRDNSFPYGCFLLTGTGIVPPDNFSLEPGDVVSIFITGIGTLINTIY